MLNYQGDIIYTLSSIVLSAIFIGLFFKRYTWIMSKLSKKENSFVIHQELFEIRNKTYNVKFCIPSSWYQVPVDYFEIGAKSCFLSMVPPRRRHMVVSFVCLEKIHVSDKHIIDKVPERFVKIKNYQGHSIKIEEFFLNKEYFRFHGYVTTKDFPSICFQFNFGIDSRSYRFMKKKLYIFKMLISSFAIDEVVDGSSTFSVDKQYLDYIQSCKNSFQI